MSHRDMLPHHSLAPRHRVLPLRYLSWKREHGRSRNGFRLAVSPLKFLRLPHNTPVVLFSPDTSGDYKRLSILLHICRLFLALSCQPPTARWICSVHYTHRMPPRSRLGGCIDSSSAVDTQCANADHRNLRSFHHRAMPTPRRHAVTQAPTCRSCMAQKPSFSTSSDRHMHPRG